jgi:hypothetical protein
MVRGQFVPPHRSDSAPSTVEDCPLQIPPGQYLPPPSGSIGQPSQGARRRVSGVARSPPGQSRQTSRARAGRIGPGARTGETPRPTVRPRPMSCGRADQRDLRSRAGSGERRGARSSAGRPTTSPGRSCDPRPLVDRTQQRHGVGNHLAIAHDDLRDGLLVNPI